MVFEMWSIVPKKLLLLNWLVLVLSLLANILAVGADPPQNCIATNPNPPDGAKCVLDHVVLTWTPGCDAALHDVYLGTDQIAVDNADPASEGIYRGRHVVSSYDPGALVKDTTYYWRIDEVEAGGVKHTGQIWTFKTLFDIPISDPNLGAWWKLDERQGTTTIDWSGYDHHGTVAGDPQWVLGYDGGALVFDGNDYVEIVGYKGVTGSHSRTCAAWIKTNTSKDIAEIITWGRDQPGEKWAFYLDNGRLAVDVHGGYIVGVRDLRDGKWHQVAVALGLEECMIIRGDENDLSMTQIKLIIDGTCEASSKVMDAPVNTASYWNVRIGGQTESNYFEGFIDDVRVYDRDVTPEIIEVPWQVLRAWNPKPWNRSKPDIEHAIPLCWSPGDRAVQHDVYLGTDEEAVVNADTSDTTGIYRGRQDANSYMPPEGVRWGGGPYYWRIDEFNIDGTITKGRLWSFTVVDYLIVDDFEAYDDFCNQIFFTWTDGWGHSGDTDCGVAPYWGNGTGSMVGYLNAPYAEQSIVNSGRQSMPFGYDNSGVDGKDYYSETERTFDSPQDWTRRGVKALTLCLYGDSNNAVEQLYLALQDAGDNIAVLKHNDPNVLLMNSWQEWNIRLRDFNDMGVNLKGIKKVYTGFGDRDKPQSGGSGIMYFDDIRLYRPRCLPSLAKPAADFSGNCIVDPADLMIMAEHWLASEAGLAADLFEDGVIDWRDYVEFAEAWLSKRLWPE